MEETAPQTFEEEVFSRRKFVPQKLEDYGFVQKDDIWTYEADLLGGDFHALLSVNHGMLNGKVIETDFDEEYLPLRVAMQTGETVTKVREAYLDLLHDIAEKCTISSWFKSNQANRIASWIEQEFHDVPDNPFHHDEGMVFRIPESRKWYGLVMSVPYCKVNKHSRKEEPVEIFNLKAKGEDIPRLLKMKGIYRAYHMNKSGWLSVLMNDTVDDEAVKELVRISHAYALAAGAREKLRMSDHDFLIPSNPGMFDVIAALEHSDELYWDQKKNVRAGDHIYLYLGAPYSAVLYQLEVIEDHTHASIWPGGTLMLMKELKRYPRHLIDRRFLRAHGVNAVRSTRRMPAELVEAIEALSHVKED